MIRYLLWRVAVMVPTLILISMLVFTIIELPPGDYFEMQVQVAADTSVDILASRSWFTAMKVG